MAWGELFNSSVPPLFKKQERGAWVAQSVKRLSDFSSGHDLKVPEFEPHIGLCADSSEPGACFGFFVSLSLCPSPLMRVLSVSVSVCLKSK